MPLTRDLEATVNLGQFNDFTPDGVLGMGNAVLVTHGNVGGGCPVTPLIDQVFMASFTPGAGPALGGKSTPRTTGSRR